MQARELCIYMDDTSCVDAVLLSISMTPARRIPMPLLADKCNVATTCQRASSGWCLHDAGLRDESGPMSGSASPVGQPQPLTARTSGAGKECGPPPLDRDCHPNEISATWRRPVLVGLSVGAVAAEPVSGGGPGAISSGHAIGAVPPKSTRRGGCLGDDPTPSRSARARGSPRPHGRLAHTLSCLAGSSRASARC